MARGQHHKASTPQRGSVEDKLERADGDSEHVDELLKSAARHLTKEVKRDMDVLPRGRARSGRPRNGLLPLHGGVQLCTTWPQRKEQTGRGLTKES